jgi:hypothetical protein
MTFRNAVGNVQVVQTDQYGTVGTFCIEENSWSGNYQIYQRTQLRPCTPATNNGGRYKAGPGSGGGRREYEALVNNNQSYSNITPQRYEQT